MCHHVTVPDPRVLRRRVANLLALDDIVLCRTLPASSRAFVQHVLAELNKMGHETSASVQIFFGISLWQRLARVGSRWCSELAAARVIQNPLAIRLQSSTRGQSP